MVALPLRSGVVTLTPVFRYVGWDAAFGRHERLGMTFEIESEAFDDSLRHASLCTKVSDGLAAAGIKWPRYFLEPRRPYNFLYFPKPQVGFGGPKPYLANVPVAHQLLHLHSNHQVVLVDPISKLNLCRLEVAQEYILNVATFADGGTLAALVCNANDTEVELQIKGGEGVQLTIWLAVSHRSAGVNPAVVVLP